MFDTQKIDSKSFNEVKVLLKSRFSVLIKTYLDDLELYSNSITQGLDSGNLKVIAENAHPLKSSSKSLGMLSIAEISEIMESYARGVQERGVRDQDALQEIEGILPQLQLAIDYAKKELKSMM